MSGTTLFVVDMQHGFGAYVDCMRDVVREIKLAKRRKDPIVFVELDPCHSGPTRPELIELAKRGGYDKVAVTTKNNCDGSKELVAAAKEAGFQFSRVRVCGVNRYACVEGTIRGLVNMGEVHTVEVGFAATAPGSKDLSEARANYARYIKGGLVIRK